MTAALSENVFWSGFCQDVEEREHAGLVLSLSGVDLRLSLGEPLTASLKCGQSPELRAVRCGEGGRRGAVSKGREPGAGPAGKGPPVLSSVVGARPQAPLSLSLASCSVRRG